MGLFAGLFSANKYLKYLIAAGVIAAFLVLTWGAGWLSGHYGAEKACSDAKLAAAQKKGIDREKSLEAAVQIRDKSAICARNITADGCLPNDYLNQFNRAQ